MPTLVFGKTGLLHCWRRSGSELISKIWAESVIVNDKLNSIVVSFHDLVSPSYSFWWTLK